MSKKQYGLGYYTGKREAIKERAPREWHIKRMREKWEKMETAYLLEVLEDYALRVSDGHYSILRFTTNWRVCLCTAHDAKGELSKEYGMSSNIWDGLKRIQQGRTLKEAIINCLVNYERTQETHYDWE